MSTKTRARRCGSKLRHRDPGGAYRQIARLEGRGAASGTYTVYACKDCRYWHVGHRADHYRQGAGRG